MKKSNVSFLKKLNKNYPERRNKPHTYIAGFQAIEAKDGVLNDFERETLLAIAHDPSKEIRLMADMSIMVAQFPTTHRVIIEKRQEGWTEQEIAHSLCISRRSVIRKLHGLYKELSKILK